MPVNDASHRRIFSLPEELIRATNTQRPPQQPRRRCYSQTANITNGADSRQRHMTPAENRSSSIPSAPEYRYSSSTMYSIGTPSQMDSLDRPISAACPPQHPYALYLQGVPGAETQSEILSYSLGTNTGRNIHSLEGYWEPLPAYSSETRISHLTPLAGSMHSSQAALPSPGSPDGDAPTPVFPGEALEEQEQHYVLKTRLCGLPVWAAGLILVLSIIAIVLSAALAAAKSARHVQQQQQPQQTTTVYTSHGTAEYQPPTLTLPPPVPSVD
jgi:hypothetical protein